MYDVLDNIDRPAEGVDRQKHAKIINKKIVKCGKCYWEMNSGMKG